ncbi:Retrovirus-related Pol polyprotein from transposon TNT 1-94 [Grifola frondosa]|uniref:Retrovirus-related Pol polyprotein from transposon TNT 1-94 n=1 Tax=Grifola frondosa TaxID=5627 RepID=A0A1C7LT47_GRIFR|nr:Retrovirus-related Pol polyprotein from transposon TNT 1-94 [Grifola frondosa]
MASKDKTASIVQNWVEARELETGECVQALQFDNGELVTAEVLSWAARKGIAIRRTAAYTSAHNGRVERLHRTLMSKSRTMRLASEVPDNRWDEFYLTANYLTIRTPTSSLPDSRTPYEAFYGSKPDLSHLREIGCKAFVLIQNRHNPKIYERSVECTLIGYGPDSKTYRCYHKPTHKVISSYHVVFVESFESVPKSLYPDCTLNSSSSTSDSPPLPSVPLSTTDSLPIPPPTIPSHPSPTVPPISSPRRSTRALVPTDKRAAADGLFKLSAVQEAVRDASASGERLRQERAQRREAAHIAASVPLELHDDYSGDPLTMREAMNSPFADEWRTALTEEFTSIKSMGVYTLIPPDQVPSGCKVMHGKPVFRLKHDENGRPVRFKARWVCKGYEAVFGQDYTHTTSPTMRMESFRAILHIAASRDWEIHQIDVKTAYLYSLLPDDEVCFMQQPPGFEEPGKENWIWQLHKGLYGMPQGGRTWNRTMHAELTTLGFTRVDCEYCVYVRVTDAGTVLAGVHVDDFILTASSSSLMADVKSDLRRVWTISDLGDARFCVGIAIDRDRTNRSIALSQTALIDKVITQFNMSSAHTASTP